MSVYVSTRVWEKSTQKPGRKITLLGLADFCDPDGVCWPGVKRLASMCNKSERQVQYDLRALEKDGEIITVLNTGRSHSNRYFIIIDLSPQEIYTILIDHEQLKMSKDDAQKVMRSVIAARKRVQSIAEERVQSTAPEPSCIEPSCNNDSDESLSAKEKPPEKDRYAALRPTLECDHTLFSRFNAERREKGYARCTKFTNATVRDKFRRAATRLDGNLDAAIEGAFEAGLGSLPKIVAYVDRWKPGGYVKPGRNNNKTSMTQTMEWLQEMNTQ